MRLIDADELPGVNIIERIEGEREVFVNSWVPATAIWAAPTVEAIPVEWIKEFANVRAANDGMDCYWHFWGEDVLQMIDQWRKENADRQR